MSANSAIFNPTETTSAATGDGFSVPRLTTTGRLAITFGTGDKGMMVYDTTLNNLFIWNGTAWESVPASGDSTNTQVIFNDNGILAGDAGLTYAKSVQRLTVTGNIDIWNGANATNTNIAVGRDALGLTAAGAGANTAVGRQAGRSVLTGSNNAFFGYQAGFGTATGSGNIAVGSAALFTNSNGGGNVAVGNQALGLSTGNVNVAVGASAGALVNSASNTISIGTSALSGASGISGDNNVGIGLQALFTGAVSLTGNSNIGIGISAGTNTTSGSSNVFVGTDAANSANQISGSDNIGIGRNTFRNLSTGNSNVAIGNSALTSCVVGDQTAVGAEALRFLTNGGNNTAVGRAALRGVSSGSSNTALGYFAGRVTAASGVTAVGASALELGTGGDYNTAIGHVALGNAVVTGGFNCALGWAAGYAVTSGIGNTFLGTNSGATTTTGSSNICIGRDSTTAATDNNVIAIGNATYFVGTNGAANTYYATAVTGTVAPPAGATGFWRVSINGTFRKIAVYAD